MFHYSFLLYNYLEVKAARLPGRMRQYWHVFLDFSVGISHVQISSFFLFPLCDRFVKVSVMSLSSSVGYVVILFFL